MLEFSSPRVADFSPTDIGAVVTKSLSFISARLYKDKIEEKARIAEHLPPVHADPVQMEQVLLNLYLNAIDAMPSGGKLTIEVTTDAGANDGGKPHVVISVADTGTGINPEHLAKIFQPFFTANKKSGLGLGLAITERIIKNHGGRIQVDSHLGQGTRFTIYLPSTFSQSDQQGTGRVEAAS
jgi:signal transduction histidine kinase